MEIVVGILASWGLIMLLWTLLGVFFLPLSRREDICLTVLLRGTGEASLVEMYLKGVLWLRDMGLIWWDVLILADGFDQETMDAVELLTEKEQHVSVVTKQMLKDWMED